MNKSEAQINFTGEFFVPGKSGERLELDHMERYRFATKFVKNKDVLDIACGFGYAGPLLLQGGAKNYVGVDINKRLVENANTTYGTNSINYQIGDICYYQANKTYDLLTCFETIEHVKDYKKALQNLHDLLKDNGTLIISSPNRQVTSPLAERLSDKPQNEYHEQEFLIEELRSELIAVGFSVESTVYGQRNSYFYFKNKYLRRLFQTMFGDQSYRGSSSIKKLYSWLTPRYFILIAHK